MKAGYIQTAPRFGDKPFNFSQVAALAAGVKADLLVLPELFATGYTFVSPEEARSMAEPAGDGPTSDFLKKLSLDTGAVIVGGFAEEHEGLVYNSAMLVAEGKVLDTYRKIHLFNREKLWFSAGNRPPEVFEINGARIGIMICFDWFFPETARLLAMKGTQIIAHPSNLVMPYCQRSMPTRCLENRVFAVTANRIGRESRGTDDFLFTGASQITGIIGEVLSSAPIDTTFIDVVEIDLSEADSKQLNPLNNLFSDRRTEFY
jgi:predicted amidohydrolase